MNNALKQILALSGSVNTDVDAGNVQDMLDIMEQYSAKYVFTGVSKRNLVTVKLSMQMQVKAVKIDEEVLTNIRTILQNEENSSIVMAKFIESEIQDALSNAYAKLTRTSNKGMETIKAQLLKNA